MARPLRLAYPGAVYHITSRGNAPQRIYADDADRETFLAVLEAVVRRYHWLCPAFCLMDTHDHLVPETPERYAMFVQEGIGRASPWTHVRRQILLGEEPVVKHLQPQPRQRKARRKLPRTQRFAGRPQLEELVNPGAGQGTAVRNRRIRQAQGQYGYTLAAIAKVVGLHYTTVSKIVNAG